MAYQIPHKHWFPDGNRCFFFLSPEHLIFNANLYNQECRKMSKITMKNSTTAAETFDDFISSRKAKGLCDKTISSYYSHFKCISRHLDINVPIEQLNKADLENMIASMRGSGLSANTISSYVRVLKAFLSWCNEEGITLLKMIYRLG